MKSLIEVGKVSSRGQIAIPSEIRKAIDLNDGDRVIFCLDNKIILIKRITDESLENLFKPLHNSKKKIKEEEVNNLIHNLRKS